LTDNAGRENDGPTIARSENAKRENARQIGEKIFSPHLNCVVTLHGKVTTEE